MYMKRTINISFIVMVVIAIGFTTAITTSAYINAYHQESLNELEAYAHIIKNLDEDADEKVISEAFSSNDFRITVIRTDGVVLYDNEFDVEQMSNHLNRDEVQKTIKNGKFKGIRYSESYKDEGYYYAEKFGNDKIIRVSKLVVSFWSIFKNAIPNIIILTALLVIICVLIAKALTQIILKPIKDISKDLDSLQNVSTYKEVMPFVELIQSQHEDITKVAKVRQEFSANVSHELKTPLTAISGYSELIRNGMTKPEDTIRFSKEIHESSRRLLELINDIMRLSELDSDEFKLEMVDVNLKKVANKCKDILAFHAEEHEVNLNVLGNDSVVKGNKRLLEEVIYNLCENAIRYNRPGGNVWVLIEEDSEKIQVTVKDDGIGIPEGDLERIFEKFYRVDKSRSKKTGGNGLGLAIVKHIVERHEATIRVESVEEEGTSMIVTFMK